MATMRRVVLTAPGKVAIVKVPVPEPGSGEVRLAIGSCGICGSDLHAAAGKHPYVPLPATPGHEFSAWIDATGPGVTGWRTGDRVTIEPNLVCGECYNCRTGRYNICTGTKELLGAGGRDGLRVVGCQGDGALADFLVVPAAKVVPIPDRLSMRHAALIEPLAVGAHACHRAGDLYGKNVAVVGAGMIGLGVLACALAAGAGRVWVLDPAPERRAMAGKLGAHRLLAGDDGDVEIIRREAGYEGIDAVFECVGNAAALRASMFLARKGARIVVIGVYGEEVLVPAALLSDREIELAGSIMYTLRDVRGAIDMLADGKFPADEVIGDVFPLDQAAEAFAAARTRRDRAKTIVEVRAG